jgi:hypothetical protein
VTSSRRCKPSIDRNDRTANKGARLRCKIKCDAGQIVATRFPIRFIGAFLTRGDTHPGADASRRRAFRSCLCPQTGPSLERYRSGTAPRRRLGMIISNIE